jgi:hypothetical protein
MISAPSIQTHVGAFYRGLCHSSKDVCPVLGSMEDDDDRCESLLELVFLRAALRTVTIYNLFGITRLIILS